MILNVDINHNYWTFLEFSVKALKTNGFSIENFFASLSYSIETLKEEINSLVTEVFGLETNMSQKHWHTLQRTDYRDSNARSKLRNTSSAKS